MSDPPITMLPTLLTLVLAFPTPQDPSAQAEAEVSALTTDVATLLKQPALRQGDRTYTVHEVLKELYPFDDSLQPALESNAEYLRFYLDSLRFYNQVRWFSNKLILDAAGIAPVEKEALLAEASAWSADRGGPTDFPESVLARVAFEIDVRARLMALQPKEYSNRELRTHFNDSVPEFFGRLKLAWIRVPLFDLETNRSFGEEERLARYALLDEVAAQLESKEITWEEAVKKYCEDPVTSKQNGRVGYLKRTDHRFDEEFLRQLFVDFGVTIPKGALLRGPITGTRWIYLTRVEKVQTEGVVDMQRVRDRVIRSLRIYRMYEKLYGISADTARRILLPMQQG